MPSTRRKSCLNSKADAQRLLEPIQFAPQMAIFLRIHCFLLLEVYSLKIKKARNFAEMFVNTFRFN